MSGKSGWRGPGPRTALLCGLASLTCLPCVGACARKSDGVAEATSSTAAGAAVAAGTDNGAANASAVQRYADERAPTLTSAVVEGSVAEVRTGADRTGDLVTALVRGTHVTEVVERGASVLILFTDPGTATRNLEGWVPLPSLGAPLPTPVPRRPSSSIVSPPSPTPEAPTTPTAPPKTTPTIPPAAPTPAAPAAHALPIKVLLVANKCSAGYQEISGKYCRLSCRAASDCSFQAGSTCRAGLCMAPGE